MAELKSISIDGTSYNVDLPAITSGLKTMLLNQIYPVGSIYMSVNSTNPGTLFGGTWARIKDTFLLSAGDTYNAGDTGGSATVKLDFEHYQSFVWNAGPTSPVDVNTAFNSGSQLGIKTKYTDNINVPHNNMPPFLVVNVWQRTA